jgi:hypothetical protein
MAAGSRRNQVHAWLPTYLRALDAWALAEVAEKRRNKLQNRAKRRDSNVVLVALLVFGLSQKTETDSHSVPYMHIVVSPPAINPIWTSSGPGQR